MRSQFRKLMKNGPQNQRFSATMVVLSDPAVARMLRVSDQIRLFMPIFCQISDFKEFVWYAGLRSRHRGDVTFKRNESSHDKVGAFFADNPQCDWVL